MDERAARSEGLALAREERERALREDRIAKAFHEAYERLAPRFGYSTREASAVPWEDVPNDNKRLMRATVRDLIDKGVIAGSSDDRAREARRICPECWGQGYDDRPVRGACERCGGDGTLPSSEQGERPPR